MTKTNYEKCEKLYNSVIKFVNKEYPGRWIAISGRGTAKTYSIFDDDPSDDFSKNEFIFIRRIEGVNPLIEIRRRIEEKKVKENPQA